MHQHEAACDPAESQCLRRVLAAHYDDGNDLLMNVGTILGSVDENLLTDANKEAVVCRKV